MSIRRIWVLFRSELGRSASNFFVAYAIVLPLVLTLLVTLVFGDLFSQTPRLGIYTEDNSQMVSLLTAEPGIRTTVYPSEAALRASVSQGIVEIGEVFRTGFDNALKSGARANLTTLVWGELPARSGLIIESALAKAAGQVAGTKTAVSLDVTQLGDPQAVSVANRLLPMLILIAMGMGGILSRRRRWSMKNKNGR